MAAALSPQLREYLAHYTEGPAYALPYRTSPHTARAALRNGLVENVTSTTVQLTDKGRQALTTTNA